MKSLIFVAGASLFVSAAHAASADKRPDFVELLMEREAKTAESAPEVDDEAIERFLLVDPKSPYSDLKQPLPILRELWREDLETAGIDFSEAFRQVAHRFGMTKARPHVDVPLDPAFGHYDEGVWAQAIKAGVDLDINRQAIEHFQFRRSAIAANFAVAAQLLRDRMKEVDPEDYDAAYILPDVLERFMALGPSDEMAEFDGEYLEGILSAETHAFRPSLRQGKPVLPPQFRVARLAAAYHDRTSYFSVPCLEGGLPRVGYVNDGSPGDRREYCLMGATDRAVYQWYLGQYRDQSEGIKRYPDQPYSNALLNLLRPIAIVSEAVGIVSFVRFSTGLRLVSRGKVPAATPERFRSKINKLTCRG